MRVPATRASRYAVTSDESGFILVAVLWIIAALAALAAIYSSYALRTAAAANIPFQRLEAEASIRAGVELAAFQVLAAPERERPTHGAFEVRVGRTKVAVRYRSEGGRIDLNAAPKELLSGLFVSAGVADAAAATFADRIMDWRKNAGQGASVAAAPASADNTPAPPHLAGQAPFNNTLELALIFGLPDYVVERVLPDVTVFSGKPQVDVVNASPEVLAALPAMTPDILHKVLEARARDPDDGRALLELLGPARNSATTDSSNALRASISVDLENGRRIQAEVVFLMSDAGDDPYDIVYWRDDFDGPMQGD